MSSNPRIHLPTLGMFFLSGMGMLLGISSAGGALILALTVFFSGKNLPQVYTLFSLLWAALLVCALLMPTLVSSFLRLLGRPMPAWQLPLPSFKLLIWLWPLLVGIGVLASQNETLKWLVVPLLVPWVVGLPLGWLVETASSGLTPPDRQQRWNTLTFGLTATMPVVFAVELFTLLIAGIAAGLYLAANPQLMAQLQRIFTGSPDNLQQLEKMMERMFNLPLTPVLVLGYMAGLVPLMEELLKPLFLWFFLPRKLTPSEGFVFGLISGCAFALLESLGSLSSAAGAQNWGVITVGRLGTGLLHITNTALVGWGLASAWSERRFMRLAATYLIAVTLHGLWNALSILSGIGNYLNASSAGMQFLKNLSGGAPLGLGALMVILFLILMGSNRRLRDASKVVVEA